MAEFATKITFFFIFIRTAHLRMIYATTDETLEDVVAFVFGVVSQTVVAYYGETSVSLMTHFKTLIANLMFGITEIPHLILLFTPL